jgi:uncharacterized protein YkwD
MGARNEWTSVKSKPLVVASGACILLGLAGCVTWAPSRPASEGSRNRVVERLDPGEAVADLVEAHNRVRRKAGRPPLEVSEALTAAAQRHADDMASHRRMAHRGSDGASPFRRMARAGYHFERAAENVAYGQHTVDGVMTAWLASRGHRRNILGEYSEIGAAYATDQAGIPYWCVTFGSPAVR